MAPEKDDRVENSKDNNLSNDGIPIYDRLAEQKSNNADNQDKLRKQEDQGIPNPNTKDKSFKDSLHNDLGQPQAPGLAGQQQFGNGDSVQPPITSTNNQTPNYHGNIPNQSSEVLGAANDGNNPSLYDSPATTTSSSGSKNPALAALAQEEGHPVTGSAQDNSEENEPSGKSNNSSQTNPQTNDEVSDKVGKGFSVGNAGLATTGGTLGIMKFITTTVKNRKGLVFGGIGGTIGILVFVISLGAIADLALNHIASDLLGYESKVERKMETDIAKKLMKKVVCIALPSGCKNTAGDPEENNKITNADAQKAAANGETLTQDMADFKFNDPNVQAAFARAGININTDSAGNLVSITDANGNNITQDLTSNDQAFKAVSDAFPEWEVGQRTLFSNLLTEQAKASFEGISPDTADNKVENAVSQDVSQGASSNEIDLSTSESNQNPSPADNNGNPPKITQSGTDTQKAGDVLNQAEATVKNAEASGSTGPEALAKAMSDLKDKVTKGFFIVGLVATLCQIEESIDKAAVTRVPEIMSLLIRHGATLLSLTSEKNAGTLTAGQVNGVMTMLEGDPTAPLNSNASKPFSASAAWQRATGGITNTNPKDINTASYTPDISPASLPVANAGQSIVTEVQSVLNFTGISTICSALTSSFGFLIQGAFGIIQIFADISSVGLAQVVTSSAFMGGQTFLSNVVVPQVLQYFSPIGLNGKESSVQWLNNSDAGLNLAFGTYSRRLGALPQTNSEANTLTSQAQTAQTIADSEQSFSNRMFAISNPDSLVSHLANYLPVGIGSDISSFEGYFSSLPSILEHTVADIFGNHSALAATTPTNPGQPYDITQYGLASNQIEQFDPIANEQNLFTPRTFRDNNVTYSFKPIDALGNPNTLVVNTNGDELASNGTQLETNDLLHCFVDSYATIYTMYVQDQPGSNCSGIGLYDYPGYKPQGSNNIIQNLNENIIPTIYCNYLGISSQQTSCINIMRGMAVANNDALRFSQYLGDVQVMNNYTSMLTNQ